MSGLSTLKDHTRVEDLRRTGVSTAPVAPSGAVIRPRVCWEDPLPDRLLDLPEVFALHRDQAANGAGFGARR